MKNSLEHTEKCDIEQLRLEADIRRALLEDEPVPDAHEQFLHFKNAHTHFGTGVRYAASVIAIAAACLLAFVLLSRQQPDEKSPVTQGVMVYEGNTCQEREVSLVIGNQTVAVSAPQASAHGISIDRGGVMHISPSTIVADEDRTTLLVPQGHVVKIELSDGTRVSLSADSRLVFPSRFPAHQPREVALVGEAFFEVARDESRPFLVNSGQLQTRVLGTVFNVRHYENQPPLVTLVSGKVCVSTERGDSLVLVPGREASMGSNGLLSESEADIEVATSWTRGEFYFDGQTLREIMTEVGRWYNKRVVFLDSQHLDDRLHFSSERRQPLGEIVRQLSDIGNIKIEIDEDVIRVI